MCVKVFSSYVRVLTERSCVQVCVERFAAVERRQVRSYSPQATSSGACPKLTYKFMVSVVDGVS